MKIKGVSVWIWLLGGFVTAGAAFSAISVSKESEKSRQVAVAKKAIGALKKDAHLSSKVEEEQREVKLLQIELRNAMNQFAIGTKLEELNESMRDGCLKRMEKEAVAGKVAVLQREIDGHEKNLATQIQSNRADLKRIENAVDRSYEILRANKLDAQIADELQALVRYCENGKEAVPKWRGMMRIMRSQISLQESIWMRNGDRTGYDKATAEYREAMKDGISEWEK